MVMPLLFHNQGRGRPIDGLDKELTLSELILQTERANLIAYWPMSEIPASQEYLTFTVADTTNINLGSAASLDDLHDDEMTVDFWVRTSATDVSALIGSGYTDGWYIAMEAGGTVTFRVNCATTDSQATSSPTTINDGNWHHIAVHFNDAGGADRKARIAIDGLWKTTGALAVDAIVTDAANNKRVGYRTDGAVWKFGGDLGWIRISDNDRLGAGVDFTAPARTTIPTEDANTVGLWPLNEGYGSVAGDLSANNNDGTITNGDWGAYPAADNAEGTAARDGTYIGQRLGQSQPPFICPFSDGVNDRVEIHTASLATAFSGAAGTVIVFGKVSAAGIWTDGAAHALIQLYADADNYVLLQKTTTNGQLEFTYRAQGTSETINKGSVSETDWFMLAITWDKTADEVKAYYNGVQEGSTQTIAGTWAGAIADAGTEIGAVSETPTSVWSGWYSTYPIWTKALTANQILDIYQKAGI